MRYTMNRSGIGRMMRSHPGIHRQLFQAGYKGLAISRSRIRNQTGAMARSGSVEDAGIQPVFRGEPRMTIRIVYRDPGAESYERKSGFLSAALGRRRTR